MPGASGCPKPKFLTRNLKLVIEDEDTTAEDIDGATAGLGGGGAAAADGAAAAVTADNGAAAARPGP